MNKIRRYGFYRFNDNYIEYHESVLTCVQGFYNFLYQNNWEDEPFQVIEMDGELVTKVKIGDFEISYDSIGETDLFAFNYLFGAYALMSKQILSHGFFPNATYRLVDYDGFVKNSVINKRIADLIKGRVVKASGIRMDNGNSTKFSWMENGQEHQYTITVTADEANRFFEEVKANEYGNEYCLTASVGPTETSEVEEREEAPEFTAFPLTKITINNNEEAWSVYQMLKAHFKE